MSFSQHAAAYRHTYFYYIGLFFIVLPMLLLFFDKWFVPAFNLSSWFSVFIATSAAAQVIVVLIPESGGRKTLYHQVFAAFSAILLIPALITVLLSEMISSATQIICVINLLIMLSTIAVLVHGKGRHEYLMLLQITYFTLFFIAILTATYTR